MSSSSAPQSSGANAGGQWYPVSHNNSSSPAGASLMLSGILSLIFIVIVISIHIYTRYRRQYEQDEVFTIVHSRTPPTRPATGAAAATVSKGLDAAAIEKLPTFPYRRPENGGGAAECVVCLSVAEEGEMVRMLPECKHLFHVGCIDMWLYSHSTCPVCRGEAKVLVTKYVFGEMVAAPRLPERVGGGGVIEAREGSSESQRRWVMMVGGEHDLERQ